MTKVEQAVKDYRSVFNIETADRRPFMIIKPDGLPFTEEIIKIIGNQGVKILSREIIPDWPMFSLYLYFKDKTGWQAEFRLARNMAYSKFEPDKKAVFCLLEEGAPEKKLLRIKYELRQIFRTRYGYFRYKGEIIPLVANCVHTPDSRHLEREWKIVQKFIFTKEM